MKIGFRFFRLTVMNLFVSSIAIYELKACMGLFSIKCVTPDDMFLRALVLVEAVDLFDIAPCHV